MDAPLLQPSQANSLPPRSNAPKVLVGIGVALEVVALLSILGTLIPGISHTDQVALEYTAAISALVGAISMGVGIYKMVSFEQGLHNDETTSILRELKGELDARKAAESMLRNAEMRGQEVDALLNAGAFEIDSSKFSSSGADAFNRTRGSHSGNHLDGPGRVPKEGETIDVLWVVDRRDKDKVTSFPISHDKYFRYAGQDWGRSGSQRDLIPVSGKLTRLGGKLYLNLTKVHDALQSGSLLHDDAVLKQIKQDFKNS